MSSIAGLLKRGGGGGAERPNDSTKGGQAGSRLGGGERQFISASPTHDNYQAAAASRLDRIVNAQRAEGTDEAALRVNIKEVLRKFIGADWRFLSINRRQGQTRFEQIAVQAIARVPESENKQLVERANAVSTPGLELVNPEPTYALPFDQVQKINRELRVALVEQARSECALYNAGKGGIPYRVALIEFADTPRLAGYAHNNRAATAYAMSASNAGHHAQPSGGGELDVADEGGPDLGVTERFWVSAQVTLRAKPL